MEAVRDAARQLLREGRICVTQHGVELGADAKWRGPIRLSSAPDRSDYGK
jgi:hypothetical protein